MRSLLRPRRHLGRSDSRFRVTTGGFSEVFGSILERSFLVVTDLLQWPFKGLRVADIEGRGRIDKCDSRHIPQ